KVVGERPAVILNPQHAAIPTMAGQPREAQIAATADDVDLANDTMSHQLPVWRILDRSDEFMPEHTGESHVSVADLQIRRADPGLTNAHERIAIFSRRLTPPRLVCETLIENERAHGRKSAKNFLDDKFPDGLSHLRRQKASGCWSG